MRPTHPDRDEILRSFGLITWLGKKKIELRILEELSRQEANVYELKWNRLSTVDSHYSTVLRALRRLEEKKLARIRPSSNVGRRKKIYACTLFGELVAVLARDGMKAIAHTIVKYSPSFRECLRVHSSFDPYYYVDLTGKIISEISESRGAEMVTRNDLDEHVRKVELVWISENIIKSLDNPSTRIRILRYLRKIAHIDWISDWIVQVLDKYVEEENEWLQALQDFKREVKTARFFADVFEQSP
jgi:DNA-binding PadR family transcriptional regulator